MLGIGEGVLPMDHRQDTNVHGSVTHDRREETIEAKTRWFRSLSMADRMDMLCSLTDLVLSVNPGLQERKHAESVAGRIQILSAT